MTLINPSSKHEAMAKVLHQYARAEGFNKSWRATILKNEPDVLRTKDGVNGYWFIGDAKVSKNENPSKKATLKRISAYIEEFCKRILDK